MPAVILPDELGAAIAREEQSMLLRRSGRTAQERSPSEVFTTPLDQLIEDSFTEV